MTDKTSPGEAAGPPTQIGEVCALTLRLSEPEIRTFARQVRDMNPLHHDAEAAHAAGYPGLIASGAHTGAIFMGITATHFSSAAPDGSPRLVLGLGFDIKFRAVVLADEDISVRWTVTSSVWKPSLNGFLTEASGEVQTPRGLALDGTAHLLLRRS